VINSDLDIAHWRQELATRGRAQVRDFLQPDAARFLQGLLRDEVPWTLAYRSEERSQVLRADAVAQLGPEGEAEFIAARAREAKGRYGFAYDSYMMVTAYKEGRDPGLPLHRVLEFFNSPDYIRFIQTLSGDPSLRRVNAQATRYRPGQFLKRHSDIDVEEGRRYAYVLNLTERWEPDWGGLLQFFDAGDRVIDTLMPRYNTLSLFRVPADHAVSLVAPWAEGPRLAITGWWLT